ncbi:MAG: helix-turn-helix transcriptional regulator [Alphaproteobacteria bacterium]|nr:helix-turn-helix transcriptional regulator [Alphaproteobacteria bacterium]
MTDRDPHLPLAVSAITSAEVARRLGIQLRKMVGPGRRWSYKGLAKLTGIDTRSLQAYAAGTACPNLAKFKRLLAVLGPELARDVDRMYGWMPREEIRLPPGAVDLEKLRGQLVGTLAVLDAMLARTKPGGR